MVIGGCGGGVAGGCCGGGMCGMVCKVMLDVKVLMFVVYSGVGGADGVLRFSGNEEVVIVGGVYEMQGEFCGVEGMGGRLCRVGGVREAVQR